MFSKVRKHLETRPLVMVATVCARQLWPETATCIISVLNSPQYRAFSLFHRGSVIHLARNTVAKAFLAHPNKPDYLLFVDDDMVFKHDALEKLLADHKDIVTGNAFSRQYPVKPVVGMFDTDPAKKGRVHVLLDYKKDALQPVDSCGMAFTLISRHALEKVGPKPFGFLFFPETDGELHEDSSFCWRAKEAGLQVWLDSRVQVGHIGDVVFDERDFEAGKEELIKLMK
uniref:Glycosyltransferase family 2 protein n=1 Tax=Eiseniibacteriota bacterium TaxID=2212470 RepID=A0A832I553_UNCEI